MPDPAEAYRAGYDKGRHDNIADAVADTFFGMLRDDPGGYYAAGYCDGARGRSFKVHGSKDATKSARKPSSASLPSPLESQWYALCDGLEFIPKEIVDRFVGALNAAGSQVAAIIGLSPFTSHTCPRCGRSGHFRIHFLGRLKHPGACGWEGYMKTGSYIGHAPVGLLVGLVLHGSSGANTGVEDLGDLGNWMYGVLAFLVVAIFRAAAAVVLIPLHCVAALSQPGQKRADIATPFDHACCYGDWYRDRHIRVGAGLPAPTTGLAALFSTATGGPCHSNTDTADHPQHQSGDSVPSPGAAEL